MRKILPLVVVGILVFSGLGAVALPGETTKVANNDQKFESVSFSQPVIEDQDQYVKISIEEANAMLMEQGKPMLPIYIHTFTFQFGTKIKSVQCTARNIHQQAITKDIIPTPEAVPVGLRQVTEKQQALQVVHYTKEPYPNTWYNYDVGSGLHDGEHCVIVKVEAYPVRHNPATHTISWAEDIDITVTYEEPSQPMSFSDSYALIILGPSEFSDEAASLVTHKNNRGISTIFVSLTDIYSGLHFPATGRDNQEKIKYFIKNAIESWGTSYVLLLGGSLKFPTRTTHIRVSSSDSEIFVSDLYYADIYNETGGFCSWDSNGNDIFGEYDWGTSHEYDDVDLYPDVYLGRLACVNGGEVTTCYNKIDTYEDDEAYTQNWFTDLIVIGGDSVPGDTHEIDEGEYVNQAVIDIMDGFIPNTLWASEGDLSGVIPSGATKMSNAINGGCGFIDFSGHGNTNIWATHPHEDKYTWLPTPYGGYLNSPHISGLSNGNKLPIVIVGACSVSMFNVDNDCFTWAFVTNSNGGSIASIGATGLGYVYLGTGATQGLIEGLAINTFEAYKDEGAITFGEMWGKALTTYINTHSMDAADYKTVEEWEPFGDPTLAIGEESQAPAKPATPSGPTSGGINEEYTYITSTTDPDGDDLQYLFDWDDGSFSGWVGPYASGATGQASHTWTVQGDYEIRVIAKDEHGVTSVWSDPLPVTMPLNNNQHPSSSQSVFLQVLQQLLGQSVMSRIGVNTQ